MLILARILLTTFAVSSLYLVLVYGLMQDFFMMSANTIKALGYSFLAQTLYRIEKEDE